HKRHERDWIEVLVVVEWQVRIERGVNRERRGVMQHGVSVRICFCDQGLSDRATRSTTVFDNKLLSEYFAELRENDAGGRVGAPCGRIGHHSPHRPVGPDRLRARGPREWSGHQPCKQQTSREIGIRHRFLPLFLCSKSSIGWGGSTAFPRHRTHPIFGAMAKSPDKPKKDPARPTRAKAARPDDKPTPDELANLLNPGIGPHTAAPGST